MHQKNIFPIKKERGGDKTNLYHFCGHTCVVGRVSISVQLHDMFAQLLFKCYINTTFECVTSVTIFNHIPVIIVRVDLVIETADMLFFSHFVIIREEEYVSENSYNFSK